MKHVTELITTVMISLTKDFILVRMNVVWVSNHVLMAIGQYVLFLPQMVADYVHVKKETLNAVTPPVG